VENKQVDMTRHVLWRDFVYSTGTPRNWEWCSEANTDV